MSDTGPLDSGTATAAAAAAAAAPATQPVSSTASQQWSLPASISARQVLPDRYTNPDTISAEHFGLGKESDPARMGIYVCLLDDRPHLHPSLLALNRHRLTIHSIPLPPDPANDHPTTTQYFLSDPNSATDSDASADVPMISPKAGPATLPSAVIKERAGDRQADWFMWKFTEEEEARRRAYLPLS